METIHRIINRINRQAEWSQTDTLEQRMLLFLTLTDCPSGSYLLADSTSRV
jgi:hypothetical protein